MRSRPFFFACRKLDEDGLEVGWDLIVGVMREVGGKFFQQDHTDWHLRRRELRKQRKALLKARALALRRWLVAPARMRDDVKSAVKQPLHVRRDAGK